jgi:perosamine synthetase
VSEAPIPYGRQSIDQRDVDEVVAALESDFLTQGPRVARFEASLAARVGAAGAVAVANGTLALELAYAALDLGPGDLALVPAITFLATATAAARRGAEVRFVDVDPETALLSMSDLERRVREAEREGRPAKLVAPVHFAGAAADVACVRELAKGAAIVEDAAHALGARALDGSQVGSCASSDAAIFSFHPVKHVTTAEGGALTFADPSRLDRAARLRSHGMHKDEARFRLDPAGPWVGPWYYECEEISTNARLSDLHAALGISQLEKLDAFLARRRALAARYDAALAEGKLAERLAPLSVGDPSSHAYHLYVVRLRREPGETNEQVALRRRALYEHLAERQIRAQVHYVPLPWQPVFHEPGARFEGAESYYASCLSLPLFPAMSDADQDRVLAALRAWSEGSPSAR